MKNAKTPRWIMYLLTAAFATLLFLGTRPADVYAKETSPMVQCTANNCNVRADASTSASLVGTADNGECLECLGTAKDTEGKTWYKVRLASGQTGYIRSDFCTPVENSTQPVRSGQAKPAAAVLFTANHINVRADACTSASIIGTANTGECLECLGTATDTEGKTWYKVRLASNNTGYIRSDFCTPVENSTQPVRSGQTKPAAAVLCTASNMNVRAEASTSSSLVGTADMGECLKYLGTATDTEGKAWYKVSLASGQTGYIRSDFCKIVEDSTQEGCQEQKLTSRKDTEKARTAGGTSAETGKNDRVEKADRTGIYTGDDAVSDLSHVPDFIQKMLDESDPRKVWEGN